MDAWTPNTAAAVASLMTPVFTFGLAQKGTRQKGAAVAGPGTAGAASSEDSSGGGGSGSSSDSDSPRTTAFNRVLDTGGLGTSAGSDRRRHQGRRGLRHVEGGAAAAAAVEDDVVDDRRDTATSRAFGGLALMAPATCGGGSRGGSRGGLGGLSGYADAEDRALLLELEHAQALMLQALTATGEPPPLLTPPPPPSPAPRPEPEKKTHGALVVRIPNAAASTATTPTVSAGSSGRGGDALRSSTCSSLTTGFDNPLVAQVATAAVGKALARLTKLSRENQGLQRLNEQLQSELSQSSSKHMELQTRSKLLHAMLAEVRGRWGGRIRAQQPGAYTIAVVLGVDVGVASWAAGSVGGCMSLPW